MIDPITDLAASAADLIAALKAATPEDRRTYLAAISRACREQGIDPETAGQIAHLFNEITSK